MNLATHADVKLLFSQRLTQARRMQGLSLRELSDKMEPGVSYNALHKYEAGAMLPESGVLLALSAALDQSIDFFFRPITVNLAAIEFRKKAKLGPKKIEQIREAATDFFERYLQVEQSLGLKMDFINPLANVEIKHGEDVEAAANQLRVAWNQGQAPLANVIELLEHHQIKVLVQKADAGFDGFSGLSGSIPVIVLNRDVTPDRMRLTALHELGHLLMRFDPSIEEKAKEKLCHRFAGAMLMPRPVFEEEFGRHRDKVTLGELIDIKGDYGISIAAIMARAHDLGSLSDAVYKQFCIVRNRKGWRENEPGEYVGETFPNRFEQLLNRAVATEAISMSLGATLAKKPMVEFQESMQLIPSKSSFKMPIS